MTKKTENGTENGKNPGSVAKPTQSQADKDLKTLTLCVFCGAREGNHPRYMDLARGLGEEIAKQGHSLVYGGGGLGLMGAVARTAHAAGAHVTGIIPHFLREAEKTLECVEHQYVETMHERKIAMFEQADGFIVLPGGIGTLEEAIEVFSWLRLNLHEKPLVYLSDNGYWDALLGTFNHVIDEGFASEQTRQDLHSATTAKEAIHIVQREIDNPREREAIHFDNENYDGGPDAVSNLV
jgi:uncharacterized protein (TIGR00730 family)